MNFPTLRSSLVFVLLAILIMMLTWPVWQWLWGEWMGNEYYSHGILIPAVSLFLVYKRFRHDKDLSWTARQGSNYGLLLTATGLAIYLLFLNQKAYYLAAFAVIPLFAGLIWTFTGTWIIHKLRFPIAYLALMIPLPFIDRSTLPLALFTGVCSGGLARLLGLQVSIVGNAVTLPNADLVIGAQCSGVNSLIALTALMVLAAYLVDGPWWGRFSLMVLAIPFAMLGNILRVASLLFVAHEFGSDAAFSFYHVYSGPIFFVLVLLLMWPITRLLRCQALRSEVI